MRDGWLQSRDRAGRAADAILLFALERPSYPVDRATYRVLVRHGWLDAAAGYDEARDSWSNGPTGLADEDDLETADVLCETCPTGWNSSDGQFCRAAAHCEGCPLETPFARGRTAKSMRKPAKSRRTDPSRPADYQLGGPMPARMYEVILPKKLGYFGKVQEVLEDLFDEQAIRSVPFIQQAIRGGGGNRPSLTRKPGSRPCARRRAAIRFTRWTGAISRPGPLTSGCW